MQAPTASPRRTATASPWPGDWVAITNAAMVATVATERSMPPVSMASVWQAARMRERRREPDGGREPGLRPLQEPRLDDEQEHDQAGPAATAAG